VSPWIKWRCRKLNSTATGTVLKMTPADSGPHGAKAAAALAAIEKAMGSG
jgi:hypothetical protein